MAAISSNKQAAGGDHRRDVGIMLLWYDQDMDGGLRIDIAERDGP